MDEKIKQTIEEMELVMHNSFGRRYFTTKDMILNNDRFFNREATALYNAGYRKESDTAREILTELKPIIINYLEEYMENGSEEAPKYFESLCKKYGVDLGE